MKTHNLKSHFNLIRIDECLISFVHQSCVRACTKTRCSFIVHRAKYSCARSQNIREMQLAKSTEHGYQQHINDDDDDDDDGKVNS